MSADNDSAEKMLRDLRGTLEREIAEIGIFLILTPPTKPMVTEAAAAGQYEEDGFSPACHDNAFKKAAREEDKKALGKLNL